MNMAFTLHRYIFRELLRVFLLATVGLTLVLSLGGILRPVQEYGVGPQQVLHILLYFMPITLTFVLPMAALFTAALTYGRFAGDNELDACRASGISILMLVYPGLMLAILVAIGNLLLSFHVMPYFVHLAEKSLKADAKQILFRNIQRRGFYSLPVENPYLIYADDADLKTDTLLGIVVVQCQDEGIRRIDTAEVTKVRFDPHDRFNEIQLTVYNCKRMGSANDFWVWNKEMSVRSEFGSLLGDDIKFKRINEMKQIRANLMLFDPIARRAQEAYTQFAAELLAQDLGRKLTGSPTSFYELKGDARSVRVSAAGCSLKEQGVVSLAPPIVAGEFDSRSGEWIRTLQSEEKAEIRVDDTVTPGLTLDLHSTRAEKTGELLVLHTVGDLALPEAVKQSLRGESLLQIVAPDNTASALAGAPGPILAAQQAALLKEMADTLIDIKAEINSRLVFGIGCVPMILIGIALGIIQKGGHLLGAFGSSCLPAAVLIIAIISGKHITENAGAGGPSGIVIMWAGLAFLVLLTAVLYRRLMRH